MAVNKIPPLDLMFFLTETAQSPKHVGAVQIFKLPARAPKTYMRDLVEAFKAAPVASRTHAATSTGRFAHPAATIPARGWSPVRSWSGTMSLLARSWKSFNSIP